MKKTRMTALGLIFLLFLSQFAVLAESETNAKLEQPPIDIFFEASKVALKAPPELGMPVQMGVEESMSYSFNVQNERILSASNSMDGLSAELFNMKSLSENKRLELLDSMIEAHRQNGQFDIKESEVIEVNGRPFVKLSGEYDKQALVSAQTIVNGYFITINMMDAKGEEGEKGKVLREESARILDEVLQSMEVKEELPTPPRQKAVGDNSPWLMPIVIFGIIVVMVISFILSERKKNEPKDKTKKK